MDLTKEILKGKTLGRALLFVALRKLIQENSFLQKENSILDIGSQKASHERVYPSSWRLTTSNYRDDLDADIVIDANREFPLAENSYDGVTMFNTLYLVDDYKACLSESLRVARKFVLFNIPLVSGIARHPVDLNRLPFDRLVQVLEAQKSEGLKEYKIIPIGGSFSSAVSLVDVYLRWRVVKLPVYLIARILDRLDKIAKHECPTQYLVLMLK